MGLGCLDHEVIHQEAVVLPRPVHIGEEPIAQIALVEMDGVLVPPVIVVFEMGWI